MSNMNDKDKDKKKQPSSSKVSAEAEPQAAQPSVEPEQQLAPQVETHFGFDTSEVSYTAKLSGANISARKARLVVNMIRGLRADVAMTRLQITHKKAATMVAKLVKSAYANARDQGCSFATPLVIVEAYVNEGPTRKRWRPRAQGRAYSISRRTCSIFVRVQEEGEKLKQKQYS